MSETEHQPVEAPVIPVREGVELRLVDPATSPEIFALVQKNLEHLKPFVNWADEIYSEEDRMRGFLFQLDQYHAGTAYPMTIWAEGKPIGAVDIRDIDSEDGAEVGYWLDEDYTGQGIASQSLTALIDFARSRHPINKIKLNTLESNTASRALAERLGFEPESISPVAEGRLAGENEVHYVKKYEEGQAD